MIFITAQPDNYYFLWQLQLQLHNFSRLGIQKENIHVLIGFEKENGLADYFQDFIATNHQAQFYMYTDERQLRSYPSSIRPHIIAKHYRENSWLEDETVFYHDSDIIFNRLPDFNQLLGGEVWFASATRSYTGTDYLKKFKDGGLFTEMCRVVNADPLMIEENDVNAGGAQYLLKQVKAEFWSRLAVDCEKMFSLLETYNNSLGSYCSAELKIQSWCSDMWCLWWNALSEGRQIATSPELDFSWAHSAIELEQHHAIVHYTGNTSGDTGTLFRKTIFSDHSPFHEDLSQIGRHTSSYTVVKEILSYNTSKLSSRIDLRDVSFLMMVCIDSKEKQETLYTICKYLSLYMDTNIGITETGGQPGIDPERLPENTAYQFVGDQMQKNHKENYHSLLMDSLETPYAVFYDPDVVIPIEQIMNSVQLLREGKYQRVIPYDGEIILVDVLMKTIFSKLLDTGLFEQNLRKLDLSDTCDYTGCVFFNKKSGPYSGSEMKRLNGHLYHFSNPCLSAAESSNLILNHLNE